MVTVIFAILYMFVSGVVYRIVYRVRHENCMYYKSNNCDFECFHWFLAGICALGWLPLAPFFAGYYLESKLFGKE